MTQHWWDEPIRMYQTNIREVDAGLEVDRVLDRMEWLGANCWMLNTAGIVADYPTALDCQYPSPWLRERASGDLIGDAVAAAHARDLRLVSRCDFSKIQAQFAAEHPDWVFRHADGSPQIYNGLYSACPSGDYYQERLFDVIAEVLDNYEIDGLFFNMFSFNMQDYSRVPHGICQCRRCHERFEDSYAMSLPRSVDLADDAYLHWLEFTRVTIDGISDRARELVKARRPDVCLFLKKGTDVYFREVNNAVDRPQPLWTAWAGEVSREVRAADRDRPTLVHCVLFLDIPYRFAPEQPGLVSFEMIQALANGANLSAYLMGVGAEIGESNLSAVRTVFQFQKEHDALYRDLESGARVGLVRSLLSEEWYGRVAGETRVRNEFRGIYELLVELHVPFDIVSDDELEDLAAEGRLSRYDVLILPNVAAVTDARAQMLDEFVAAGGGLVATYESGWYHEDGSPRREQAITSLGVARVLYRQDGVSQARSSYFRVGELDGIGDLEPGRLIAIDEALLQVEASDDADAKLELIPPSRYGPPEKCYWDITTNHPGLLLRASGKGRTAYLPWGLGALYYRLNLAEYRQVLAEAIDQVAPAGRQVETNASPHVEVVVGQSGDATVLHLLNYSGQRGRAFHDPIELHDITVGVRAGKAHSATALALGSELPVEQRAGRVWVTLPRLGLFEAIRFG